ncbi:Protein CIA1 [Cardamine amara subsp. amara]|uniref:Protein CIA1 n=1 Tax=Cardamine amara subsp. amara TaxID=228776 RepID=A0ABD1AU69_CARAN
MQSGEEYVPWAHLCTLSGFHDRSIFSVHWSRDGVIASGASDDAIRLFVDDNSDSVDRPFYKLLLKKEKAHEMDVNSVQWAPDHKEIGLLASASDDGMVKIWKLALEP